MGLVLALDLCQGIGPCPSKFLPVQAPGIFLTVSRSSSCCLRTQRIDSQNHKTKASSSPMVLNTINKDATEEVRALGDELADASFARPWQLSRIGRPATNAST